MAKLIEMVCTGNQGRSPVAELVANNYIHEMGVQDEYQAISSGTMVDHIKAGEVSPEFMKQVIGIARKRTDLADLYSPQELNELDTALRLGNDEALRKYFHQINRVFVDEERADRSTVLSQLGIEGLVKQYQEQTIPRPNTIAVLSMARRNNSFVQSIYAATKFNPVIAVLSQYLSGIVGDEIPNAFGLGSEAYLTTVQAIKEQVPQAIDKVIDEDRRNNFSTARGDTHVASC
ncbi:hypothetical protein HYT52_04345 [Candidatus Woesearchaeota archaeon]|nr:hypothetical protein [Candidatus Woesearchaeota archaeon]